MIDTEPEDLNRASAVLTHYRNPLVITLFGTALSITLLVWALNVSFDRVESEFFAYASNQSSIIERELRNLDKRFDFSERVLRGVYDVPDRIDKIFPSVDYDITRLLVRPTRDGDFRISTDSSGSVFTIAGDTLGEGRSFFYFDLDTHVPKLALVQKLDLDSGPVLLAHVSNFHQLLGLDAEKSELEARSTFYFYDAEDDSHPIYIQGPISYFLTADKNNEGRYPIASARRLGSFHLERSVSIAGREFILLFVPSEALFSQTQSGLPWLLFLFCLVTTGLLSYASFRVAVENLRIGNEVRRRTKELYLSQMKVQDEAERLRAVMNTALDGIITIDADGIIQSFNPAASTVLGYEESEVIGRNVNILMPEPYHSEHDGYLKNFFETGEKKVIGLKRELTAMRKNRELFPIELGVNEMLVSGKRMFVGTLRDISERKTLENELKAYTRQLEASNRQLDEFAYIASHDLKAPLRVIDNASQWLVEDIGDTLDAESKENIELIRSRISRMERFLDDLLDYSRVGRKKDSRFSEIVSGAQMVSELSFLIPKADHITISVGGEFKKANFYKMPLFQILTNLISNAVKHHDKETGRIEIDYVQVGDQWEISVTDDGPGIPEAYREKVFKIFQTLRPRDQVEGSGIGLSVVKRYIETEGESIILEPGPTGGARFRFTWKCADKNMDGADD